MLSCHSCYTYGTWRSREVGRFKLIVWREAKGRMPQSKGRGPLFAVELTPQVFYQNYQLISASFDLKRVL